MFGALHLAAFHRVLGLAHASVELDRHVVLLQVLRTWISAGVCVDECVDEFLRVSQTTDIRYLEAFVHASDGHGESFQWSGV